MVSGSWLVGKPAGRRLYHRAVQKKTSGRLTRELARRSDAERCTQEVWGGSSFQTKNTSDTRGQGKWAQAKQACKLPKTSDRN